MANNKSDSGDDDVEVEKPTDSPNSNTGSSTVANIRHKFRDLTKSVLGSPSPSPSSSPNNPSDTSTPANSTEWDEICLGIWTQDKQNRREGQSGKCHGIAIIKTDSPTDQAIIDFRPSRALLLVVLAKNQPSPQHPADPTGGNSSSSSSSSDNTGILERWRAFTDLQMGTARRISTRMWDQPSTGAIGMDKTAEMAGRVSDSMWKSGRRVVEQLWEWAQGKPSKS